jgi:hypothetical protein
MDYRGQNCPTLEECMTKQRNVKKHEISDNGALVLLFL